jgi:hypothetical protein
MNAGGLVRLSLACGGGFAIGAAGVLMLQRASLPDLADPARLSASRAVPSPEVNASAGVGPCTARVEPCETQRPRRARAEAEVPPDPSPEPRAESDPTSQRGEARRAPELSDALGRFNETRLRAAGFGDRDIEQLGERILWLEREALAEREDAQRRGELPRERRLSDQIWRELRADYGDEVFATLLFATNQVNRVEVEAVAPNSPAESAGVLPGDVIVYYDRQRIFSPQELRQVRRGDTAGNRSTVPMEVLREGRRVSFSLPPGLSGVRVAGRSMDPGTP